MTQTMNPANPETSYLRGEVEVSDGVQMTVMLYNRLIRDLRGIAADLEDPENVSEAGVESARIALAMGKCRDILTFFLDTLDPDDEATEGLANIYYAAIEQILTAQMEKSSRPITQILPSLELLRDRWVTFQKEQKEVNA